MRGRGVKHFFPSGSAPGKIYLNQRFSLIRSRTSVRRPLIWCPNSHRIRSIMSKLRFWKFSSKMSQKSCPKEVPKVLPVSLNFINGDPLSDRPKSKVQTTGRQEPCHPPPPDPFRKDQLFSERTKDGRTSVFLHYRMERALRANTPGRKWKQSASWGKVRKIM